MKQRKKAKKLVAFILAGIVLLSSGERQGKDENEKHKRTVLLCC